jgi:thioredoxin 1
MEKEIISLQIKNMKQLLYFSAPWCGPCRMLGPIMDELAQTYPIRKINVDTQPDLAREYGVISIPTTVLLVDSKETERKVGVQPKNYYVELFK